MKKGMFTWHASSSSAAHFANHGSKGIGTDAADILDASVAVHASHSGAVDHSGKTAVVLDAASSARADRVGARGAWLRHRRGQGFHTSDVHHALVVGWAVHRGAVDHRLHATNVLHTCVA